MSFCWFGWWLKFFCLVFAGVCYCFVLDFCVAWMYIQSKKGCFRLLLHIEIERALSSWNAFDSDVRQKYALSILGSQMAVNASERVFYL